MSKFKNVLGQIKIVIWSENQILVGRDSTGETFLVGGEHANFRVHGGFPPPSEENPARDLQQITITTFTIFM